MKATEDFVIDHPYELKGEDLQAIEEASPDEKDKDDCFLMLEGLAAALDTRDILMIRAIWCGLKKELEKNNLCKVQIGRMQEQMKLYLVLK